MIIHVMAFVATGIMYCDIKEMKTNLTSIYLNNSRVETLRAETIDCSALDSKYKNKTYKVCIITADKTNYETLESCDSIMRKVNGAN